MEINRGQRGAAPSPAPGRAARCAGDISAEHISVEDHRADDWRADDRGIDDRGAEHDCGTEENRPRRKSGAEKESGAADLSVDDAGFVRSAAPPAGRP
ncbi:hypothetical protein GJ689_00465 [Rhodoplanes serenus]|uniref:Uncharacterized protein n=1 Tax=Rhodoplanes serenus TaxID=200615 RepID=A0A9X5AR47_9BRAD|nr:hypothetical protein [Rhodoplanes serenus]MTW14688.1 hypothetical protein [Rhodoplanes serenus]